MKGVVLSVTDTSAVVLTDDGLFVSAKNDKRNPYRVGQTVLLAPAKKSRRLAAWLAAAAAAVVLIVGGGAAYYTPVTYVSLDVNPSIYYTLNMFDRVLDVEPVNEDAKAVLDKLNLKNKSITAAVEQTIGRLIDEGYIAGDDNGGVVIATSNRMNGVAETLADHLQEAAQKYIDHTGKKAVVDAQAVGKDVVEQAKKLGVTPGKLNLVQKLKNGAPDPDSIDIDEWLKKPVKDINRAIKENRKANGGSGTSTTAQSATPSAPGSPASSSRKADTTSPSATERNNGGSKNGNTKGNGKPAGSQTKAGNGNSGDAVTPDKAKACTTTTANAKNNIRTQYGKAERYAAVTTLEK